MKKYGFFGGSFNPVTKAHVDLALEIVKMFNMDKVIFVPVGDNYNKKGLINEKHRYNMLKIATNGYKDLEISDIELNQDRNLTTLEAFQKIEESYDEISKYYIIGADNLYKMILSKDLEILAQKYKYIVIQRGIIDTKEIIKSNEILKENKKNFYIMENTKHNDTSSTEVRKNLESGNNNLESILQKEVLNYIEKNRLYSC